MNCGKCGANLEPNDSFCPICGAPVPTQNQYQNNNGGMQNENMGFSYERPVNEQIYNNVQQPNVQQNMGQNYGQPTGEVGAKNLNGKNSNNNSTIKAVVITIIVMAVLATLILLIYTLFSASKEENKNNKGEIEGKNSAQNVTNTNRNDNRETNTNDIDDDYYNNYYSNTSRGNTTSNGNSNTTPNTKKTTSTYTVNMGGFELYVPDDLLYELKSDGTMIVTNMDDTWVIQMGVEEQSYQEIKQKRNSFKSLVMEQLATYNPTVSDAKIETINGVEYMFVEITMQGESMILAYTQLNSKYIATIIATSEEDFDREPLRETAPIFSTASYTGNTSNTPTGSNSDTGNTSNIKTNFNINMNDIKKIYED